MQINLIRAFFRARQFATDWEKLTDRSIKYIIIIIIIII